MKCGFEIMKKQWFFIGLSVCFCLFSNAASAYKKAGFRWVTEGGPIMYQIHSAGSGDVTDGSDFERIEAAFQAWSCAEGTNLRFIRGEDVDTKAQQGDGG